MIWSLKEMSPLLLVTIRRELPERMVSVSSAMESVYGSPRNSMISFSGRYVILLIVSAFSTSFEFWK